MATHLHQSNSGALSNIIRTCNIRRFLHFSRIQRINYAHQKRRRNILLSFMGWRSPFVLRRLTNMDLARVLMAHIRSIEVISVGRSFYFSRIFLLT